jgi:hypothetical protein
MARVLIHAEDVRRTAALDFPDVGIQAWRGADADGTVLDRCGDADDAVLDRCEAQARALADDAYARGSGAFWDGVEGQDE